VTYLASAPKSNASYTGLKRAMADVEQMQSRPVPKHLRDSRSATGRKHFGESPVENKDYIYPHDQPGNYVKQQYIPDGVQSQRYYEPTENGAEKAIKERMEGWKAQDDPHG
jgi:putative ATPase